MIVEIEHGYEIDILRGFAYLVTKLSHSSAVCGNGTGGPFFLFVPDDGLLTSLSFRIRSVSIGSGIISRKKPVDKL